MARQTFRIRNYEVFLGSKLLPTATIGTPAAVPAQAMIQCTGEPGKSLVLFFLNSQRNVSNTHSDDWPNRSQINGNASVVRGEVFVPTEQFSWYVDILRNESPVFAHIDDGTPLMNRISCREPVGEGEYFS